jgi:hypothetical protein
MALTGEVADRAGDGRKAMAGLDQVSGQFVVACTTGFLT